MCALKSNRRAEPERIISCPFVCTLLPLLSAHGRSVCIYNIIFVCVCVCVCRQWWFTGSAGNQMFCVMLCVFFYFLHSNHSVPFWTMLWLSSCRLPHTASRSVSATLTFTFSMAGIKNRVSHPTRQARFSVWCAGRAGRAGPGASVRSIAAYFFYIWTYTIPSLQCMKLVLVSFIICFLFFFLWSAVWDSWEWPETDISTWFHVSEMLKHTKKTCREFKQKVNFLMKTFTRADVILSFCLMANRWILRPKTDFEQSFESELE